MNGFDDRMHDGHGRVIDDLRVSVTDLCNLRCQYCMPAEGVDWMPRDEILSFEEIVRLLGVFTRLGVTDVRLTGGEPLVRRGFPELARRVAAVPGIADLSITTNGVLLERDAAALVDAGIRRFNVSLDALDPERYRAITRRDTAERVLAGLDALLALPGERVVKINAVAIRGVTEHEAVPLVRLAMARGVQVRFIERMPLGADRAWRRDDLMRGDEVRALVEEHVPLVPVPREPHATARVWRPADGDGEVAFISPVSEPFCADCNRIRLTADGRLRTCLFSVRETDLREPLRDGADDGALAEIIRGAVWRKELKHRIGEPGFVQPERSMSRIGG